MALPSYATTPFPGCDDRNIPWGELPPFEHFVFAMLNVDHERRIADFVALYEAQCAAQTARA